MAAVLAALLAVTGPAEAAFPGPDGLLAVQPLKGSGVVLVKANGGGERLICAEPVDGGPVCSLARPQWSPDGRALAVEAPSLSPKGSIAVIYPDGSCLNCKSFVQFFPLLAGADAAFTNNPTLLTAVQQVFTSVQSAQPALVEYGIDGLVKETVLPGAVSDPVWSARGELAFARDGWIWVGNPGKVRRLTRGSAPSWSPDGSQIVLERKGWLVIAGLSRRFVRRLVRGTAPAWSPDGRWIAFFGRGHRLSVVPDSGGRVRHVGEVTGSTVDWQPLPAKPPVRCLTPPGSTVMASSSSAMVSVDNVTSVFVYPPVSFGPIWASVGCVRADGRERVLDYEVLNNGSSPVIRVVLAGPYAAEVRHGGYKYCEAVSSVAVFDLRTGAGKGGISIGCAGSIDQLVLGSDGVMATHTTAPGPYTNGNPCNCTVEQIQASDSTGIHTLDSVTEPNGSATALTGLTLTGDTLTWDHNGTPRSAQLQP